MAMKTNKIVTGDKVEIKLERAGAGEEQDLYVAINGISFVIPRGKRVSVPAFVADEIRRRERAIDRADDNKKAELERTANGR